MFELSGQIWSQVEEKLSLLHTIFFRLFRRYELNKSCRINQNIIAEHWLEG